MHARLRQSGGKFRWFTSQRQEEGEPHDSLSVLRSCTGPDAISRLETWKDLPAAEGSIWPAIVASGKQTCALVQIVAAMCDTLVEVCAWGVCVRADHEQHAAVLPAVALAEEALERGSDRASHAINLSVKQTARTAAETVDAAMSKFPDMKKTTRFTGDTYGQVMLVPVAMCGNDARRRATNGPPRLCVIMEVDGENAGMITGIHVGQGYKVSVRQGDSVLDAVITAVLRTMPDSLHSKPQFKATSDAKVGKGKWVQNAPTWLATSLRVELQTIKERLAQFARTVRSDELFWHPTQCDEDVAGAARLSPLTGRSA